MVQRSEQPRFALEAGQFLRMLGELFRKDFNRDFATELGVASTVDFAHATRTDLREDLVLAEFGSGL